MSKGRGGSHMKIRSKLVLYFVVLLAIPILILGIYTYRQSWNSIKRQSILTIENNLNSLIREMDSRCDREATYIKYLAYNLNFRRILEEKSVNRGELAMELNRSVEPIFWYYITSDDFVKSIEVFTDRLEDPLGEFMKPDQGCRSEGWYQRHQEEMSSIWTYQKGELFVSRSILDVSTVSKTIAVIRIDLFPSTFFAPLEEIDFLDNGVIITDAHGDVIYSRPTRKGAVDEAVMAAVQAGNAADTDAYVLRSGVVDASGWRIHYYVDYNAVLGQLQGILQKTLQIVGIVILLAFGAIGLFSQTLSRRILLLRDHAERVAAGDLRTVISTEDTDEIGTVINSFGFMTQRLDQMIYENYTLQLEKKATELAALQAQINPHFLYNALSSIKWKAIRQGNDDISDITGFLATFYRTSLNSGKPFTTVKNELNNIRSYVELQKQMHSFDFRVVYHIDSEALQLTMLNFLLQPIVENAIKHGIDYTDEKENGELIIECSLDGEHLLFCIKNNGPKIQEEVLKNSLSKPGKGYGIYNIKERIDLYYGAGCGLDAYVDDSGYTCFTVRIKKYCTENEEGKSIK